MAIADSLVGLLPILRIEYYTYCIISPVFPFLRSDCRAAADIETESAQIDDVAHGGHAANAWIGQIHLVFYTNRLNC